MNQAFDFKSRRSLAALAALASASLIGEPAKATDEIQVYNASIAAVGQFTIQQHLNYVPQGLTNPPFPGGIVSNPNFSHKPAKHLILLEPRSKCSHKLFQIPIDATQMQ